MPFAAKLATSPKLRKFRRGWFEIKRRLVPSLNTEVFYHRVDDPYSYLLLQAMPRFLEDFRVNLQIRFVLDLPADGGYCLRFTATNSFGSASTLAHCLPSVPLSPPPS